MNKSEQFDSKFGVLNAGMSVIMIMLLSLGLLSYLKYGDEVHGSVTFNLGKDLYVNIILVLTSLLERLRVSKFDLEINLIKTNSFNVLLM